MKQLSTSALEQALLFAAAASFAQEEPAPPPASPGFYPSQYLLGYDACNFADFASQADAQAVLRADPADPNQRDNDRPAPDGIACESNRAPFDRVPVLR
jgi:hypothetical protein